MDVWIAMIKDVGFPAVVTFFLLYRIEGKLDELIDSVRGLPLNTKNANPDDAAWQTVKKQG